ncbi:hypothetical protein SDC9_137689 [bioreactor metagenome]|uniref:Uncharacterized protein n=1 Tax=bioreactor metagenome TaxID=1076179 RepID=A0A645DN89_9ZZZZ
MPPFATRAVQNAVRLQTTGDLQHTGTFKVFPVDALDNFGFLRHNHQMLVFVLGIAEEPIAVDLDFTLLVAVLQTQLHILAQGLAFLLSKGCHNCKHDLALGIHGVDIFLFKVNGNVLFLELADVF